MPTQLTEHDCKALSVIVSNYTDDPSNLDRSNMKNFVASFFGVYDLPAPPADAYQSRMQLTEWLMQSGNVDLWFGAGDTVESPRRWGPYIWRYLHAVADKFQSEKKAKFEDLLFSLGQVLPCHECGNNFQQLLLDKEARKFMETCHTSMQFATYVSELHAEVTKHKKKKKRNDA